MDADPHQSKRSRRDGCPVLGARWRRRQGQGPVWVRPQARRRPLGRRRGERLVRRCSQGGLEEDGRHWDGRTQARHQSQSHRIGRTLHHLADPTSTFHLQYVVLLSKRAPNLDLYLHSLLHPSAPTPVTIVGESDLSFIRSPAVKHFRSSLMRNPSPAHMLVRSLTKHFLSTPRHLHLVPSSVAPPHPSLPPPPHPDRHLLRLPDRGPKPRPRARRSPSRVTQSSSVACPSALVFSPALTHVPLLARELRPGRLTRQQARPLPKRKLDARPSDPTR